MTHNLYTNSAYLYDMDKWFNELSKHDIPFFLEYATEQMGDILELACGTGRVSLSLAEKGFNVVAVDWSDAMLKQFRIKTEKLPDPVNRKIKIHKCNMASFNLGKKFALIIIPNIGFQYLTNDQHQRSCLQCISKHLDKNGILIFQLFKPSRNMMKKWVYPERKQWEVVDPRTGFTVIKSHRGIKVDTRNQIIDVEAIYDIIKKDDERSEIRDIFSIKYYYYNQIKRLLKSEKFIIEEEFGFYDKRPIDDGDELIFVCRKKDEAREQDGDVNWRGIWSSQVRKFLDNRKKLG